MEILCYTDMSFASRVERSVPRSRRMPNVPRPAPVARAELPSWAKTGARAAFSAAYGARKALFFAFAAIAAGWLVGFCAFFVRNAVGDFFSGLFVGPSARADARLLREMDALDRAMARFVAPGERDTDADGMLSDAAPQETASYTKPVSFAEYVVKSGDTISHIARQAGLTNISTIISVNGIKNARQLRVGQTLSVPSIDGIFYTVRTGDSLAGISAKFDIVVEDILDVNDLDSSVIMAGNTLFLPGAHMDSDALKEALGELFANPLGGAWRLSSGFGPRPDPFTGVRSQHTGIDMVAPMGTPILASMGGTVTASGYSSVYGNYVIVSHGNGYQTLYGHMQKILAHKGARVEQGTKIGTVGNTGYSTGPHLHFTVYKNGSLIDPLTVLRK